MTGGQRGSSTGVGLSDRKPGAADGNREPVQEVKKREERFGG
jgi:hypothetical protein